MCMKILAIDTATEACSVALLSDEPVKGIELEEIFEIIPRQHTERVLPMVDSVLEKTGVSLSQLDALAFNCGPGSFTGVRVGTSVAQGLAFSVDLPVIPVSSLAAIAQLAYREGQHKHVLSSIDARMNEMYWACYQENNGLMTLLGEEKVNKIEDVEVGGSWHCQGSGWDTFQTELNESKSVSITSSSLACFPHAQDIAVLAADSYKKEIMLKAEEAIPSYVRNEVTWKKLKDQ